MIKICSLDFINKKVLEADLMGADGSVLVKSGELITPELLLRLYFIEIFVEQPIVEEIFHLQEAQTITNDFVTEEILVEEKQPENIMSSLDLTNELITEEIPVQSDSVEVVIEQSVPELVSAKANLAEASSSEISTHETTEKAPRSSDLNTSFGKNQDSNSDKGPRLADGNNSNNSIEKDENTKGPRLAEPNFNETVSEKPRTSYAESSVQPQKIEPPKEDPLDKQLEFDENVAQRIVQTSIKIGKMLNYSIKELKELEQVAYYSNIGISKFKKRDSLKRSFRKMKLLASYEKLINEGTVSEDIAELVKYCIHPYDSETFQLNSKVPYHHIVSITSFYEDLLAQNDSKQDTLSKMLQLGGNQFNPFILHKFISMMRGFDE